MYFEKNLQLTNFNDSNVKPALKLTLLEKVIVKGQINYFYIIIRKKIMKSMVSILGRIRTETDKPLLIKLSTTFSSMVYTNTQITVGLLIKNRNGFFSKKKMNVT